MNNSEKGKLYLVGVGPGNPELMTCLALQVLQDTRVWVGPKAKSEGSSTAVAIAADKIDLVDKEVVELCFPMKKISMNQKVDGEVMSKWQEAARVVLSYLNKGEDVAFPTLGDPGVYSTAFYLLSVLQAVDSDLRVKVIPGITAMSASSASLAIPLCLGDDILTVVPAAFDDERLRRILRDNDTIVLMKVFRSMDRLVPLLAEFDLLGKAVLIERCSLVGEVIHRDLRQTIGKELHYFSTILVRKKGLASLC